MKLLVPGGFVLLFGGIVVLLVGRPWVGALGLMSAGISYLAVGNWLEE